MDHKRGMQRKIMLAFNFDFRKLFNNENKQMPNIKSLKTDTMEYVYLFLNAKLSGKVNA